MKIIGKNEDGAKKKWGVIKIERLEYDWSTKTASSTGTFDWATTTFKRRRRKYPGYSGPEPEVIEFKDLPIFEATLRPTTTAGGGKAANRIEFEDVETGETFTMYPDAIFRMMQLLILNGFEKRDDAVRGIFTFASVSGTLAIQPYEGKVL